MYPSAYGIRGKMCIRDRLAGVYSSVFLAAPMWSLMADRSDRKKNGAAKTKSKKKTKTAKA